MNLKIIMTFQVSPITCKKCCYNFCSIVLLENVPANLTSVQPSDVTSGPPVLDISHIVSTGQARDTTVTQQEDMVLTRDTTVTQQEDMVLTRTVDSRATLFICECGRKCTRFGSGFCTECLLCLQPFRTSETQVFLYWCLPFC